MRARVFDPKGSQVGWYVFDGDSITDESLRYRPALFDIYAPYQWSYTSHNPKSKAEFLIDSTSDLPHTDPRFTPLIIQSVAVPAKES